MVRKEECMDMWLLHRQGHSLRAISRMTGLHRDTVTRYLRSEEFPRYKAVDRRSNLEPYHRMIRDWLSGEDYRATRIYELVTCQGYRGSYETVKRYVGRVKGERDRVAYLRFETDPGFQAQVDFADFKVINPDGGEETFYCFVMILGFSRHMYVEFVDRCTMPVFLDCHKNAFGYFGGVPGEILYDNMKNVVIRRLVGRAEFNAVFSDFALHYRFKPAACPPYSPWYKGKVERPMNYIRERFWRGYRFTDPGRANRDVLHWLDTMASERIHGTHREKVRDRFETEKPRLGEIPRRPYDTSEKIVRKVYKDCLVSFGGNQYRVPHRFVGRKILLKVKNGLLRAFYEAEFLVAYQIPAGRGHIVSHSWLIKALKNDREQLRRKYRVRPKGKGKATRGLLKDGLRFETVQRRPLYEYARAAGGEA